MSRVVAAIGDPDPRTDGVGLGRLAAAGITVETGVRADEARASMAGFLCRRAHGRPLVTLKLATSLDGRIAMADGSSRWITGPEARAHAHGERGRHEAILVGRGTWEVDRPALDVRLAGLEGRSPVRVVLSSLPHLSAMHASPSPDGTGESGVIRLSSPADIAALPGDHLLVEGGARAAAAFLAADLVDRLLLYRAPVLIGDGRPALGDIGLTSLADAHGRWRLADARQLGSDRMEAYLRT